MKPYLITRGATEVAQGGALGVGRPECVEAPVELAPCVVPALLRLDVPSYVLGC